MESFHEAINRVANISDSLQEDIAECVNLRKIMMASKSSQEFGERIVALLDAHEVALARNAEAVLALAVAISVSDRDSTQRTIDIGEATLAELRNR